jgi:hypothetical protein
VDTNIKLSNEIAYLNISSTINYDSIKYSLNRLLEERKWVAIAILDHSENTYYKELYDYLNVKIFTSTGLVLLLTFSNYI